MRHDLPPPEIETRRPVWLALSEFWLDTELDEVGFRHVARLLAESPYSIAQIRAIHEAEVAPVLWRNLAGVAGEWAGFDAAWLVAECSSRAARRHEPLRRLQVWCLRPRIWFFTRACWESVLPLFQAIRNRRDCGGRG